MTRTKKIGGWNEMEYDKTIVRKGITWYRVKDGMGGQGDREDWVASVPELCISVHDYQWREPRWGIISYPSFKAALDGEILRGIESGKSRLEKKKAEIERLTTAVAMLEKSAK